MSGRLYGVALGIVLTVAVLVRLSSPSVHFTDGVLVPVDADAAYHIRRAMAWVEGFPWPPLFDPWLGYPEGAHNPWAPGWSAALAAFAWVCGAGDVASFGFQVGLAAFPLVVGVLTVAVAAAMARRLAGDRGGLVAGVCVALMPHHVAATQFARPDHSGAEGLYLLLLVSEASRQRPRTWALALIAGTSCLVWVGAVAYLGIVAAGLFVASLLVDQGRLARAGVPGLLAGAAVMAPVAVLNGLEAGQPFSYAFLSAFQPAFLAGLAAGSGWLVLLVSRPQVRARLLVVGAVAGLLAVAVLGPTAVQGWEEWLQKGDPWLATVTEFQPFLRGPFWRPDAWSVPTLLLGWAYPAMPVVALWLGWQGLRQRRGGLWALAVAVLGGFTLSLLQNRFGYSLAPVMGVALGVALAGVPLAPALALLLFAQPVAELQMAYLMPKTRQNRKPWTFEAYRWLDAHVDGPAEDAPAWGVGGRWWHGHWLPLVAGQPEHIGHFGSYAGGVQRYRDTQQILHEDARTLTAYMDRHHLRYWVVESYELLELEGPLRTLLAGGGATPERPAVTGLRAVFASRGRDPGAPLETPGAWVYERVPGATLTGWALPGVTVEVRIGLYLLGKRWTWSHSTVADEDGRFALTVPYATGLEGGVPTSDTLRLVRGDRVTEFALPDALVRAGGTVEVPGQASEVAAWIAVQAP